VVNAGSVILDEKRDTNYMTGFSKIEFNNGKFSSINFDSTNIFGLQTLAPSSSYLQSFGEFMYGEDENYNLITATWQLDSLHCCTTSRCILVVWAWLVIFAWRE